MYVIGLLVGADVNLVLQIDGQVFRILAFDDFLVLGKNLVVEIKGILQRRVPVRNSGKWARTPASAAPTLQAKPR